MLPLAFNTDAGKQFYEAAAQVIPVLFLAAAVGESRLKVRRVTNPYAAMSVIFIVAFAIAAGEVAALRVLVTGDGSETTFGLTTVSLGLGLGFVIQYLALAAYQDVAGDAAEPSETARWMLFAGALVVGGGTAVALIA
jgi:hypothetical protein